MTRAPYAMVSGDETPLGRSRLALEGLSVGDAFGERFFGPPEVVATRLEQRLLPLAPWFWTDDTAMALSVYDVLKDKGAMDRDLLARAYADRYRSDPARGYGGTAHGILMAISLGTPWQEAAGEVFDGQGSMGNGGAMRATPIGGYFADDLERVVREARASAEPTHAHPDGQAGAIAAAVAAAIAWQMRTGTQRWDGVGLIRETARWVPSGATREGLERARDLPLEYRVDTAVSALGNGSRVISADTVPFAIWCAARHLDDYTEALWTTVSGLGDRDTTCAIVGGIVAMAVGHGGLNREFAAAREPLDSTLNRFDRALR